MILKSLKIHKDNQVSDAFSETQICKCLHAEHTSHHCTTHRYLFCRTPTNPTNAVSNYSHHPIVYYKKVRSHREQN